LKAAHEGRVVEWEQPVAISFAAHETQLGPTVDRFECQSSFLQVKGQGRADDLSATATFDLSQLLEKLGQVVDLGGVRLAGTGEARWTWQRGAKQDFTTQFQFQAQEFLFEMPDVPPWSEPRVEMTGSASGRTDLTLASRIDKAQLRVVAGSEVLEAKLTRSLRDLSAEEGLPVDVRSQGRLEGGWARLKSWYPMLQSWEPNGQYELTAQGTLGRKAVTVGQASMSVTEFQLVGPGLKINEPRVQVAAMQGVWDRPARRLDMKQALFQSSAFATAIDRLQFCLPSQAPATLTGVVGYQGNLERMQTWFFGPLAARGWQLGGTFTGQGELRESAGVIGGTLETTVSNLFMVNGNGRRLSEPQMRLNVRGDYNLRSGAIQVQQCDLASTLLAFTLTGRVDKSRMRPEAELSGNVRYDLERLSHVWQPYLGDALQIVGSGTTPAFYRGPFALADAQGGAGVNWASGMVYGFPIGPGTLKASLANGTLQIEPVSFDMSEGKVQLRPTVRLAQAPAELVLEPGIVAQQVRVTPEMCNALLKYAMPVVAGVTKAEGRFSVQLEGCRVPLADPRQADVSGKLVVHALDVSATPLIQAFATVLNRKATGHLTKESIVPFQLRQGRVYHEGMELAFQDVTIRTSGSVGLDQSINLAAEAPLPQRVAGNNPTLMSALRNQIVKLPFTGSLERPTVDRRALDNANRQFIGNATKNVLEDNLQKQLNRLLTPPQE
jgi:translocation and assembly module TamB